MSTRWGIFGRSVFFIVVGAAWVSACKAPTLGSGDGDGDGDSDSGDGDGDSGKTTGIVLTSGDGDGDAASARCADGVRDSDEACDDGNAMSGDGCPSNCKFIEPGFICPKQGEPCRPFTMCGDGIVSASEQCDGGPNHDVVGCSTSCQIEMGYKCEVDASGASVCSATTCQDNVKEGAEACDDGNAIPFDGCSPTCTAEPNCTDSGCTSECGDGMVIAPESCDDGNLLDGDGCSSTCTVEDGFKCTTTTADCEMVGGECVLKLPIIYRDFSDAQPDFEAPGNCTMSVTGVVNKTLTNGKPTLLAGAAACITSADSFAAWYADNAEPLIVDQQINLFPDAHGGFVNRVNNEGERFYANEKYVKNVVCEGAGCCVDSADPNNCCELSDTCQPCKTVNVGQACSGVWMDGNPTFFPLEGHAQAITGEMTRDAYIPPPYANWSLAGKFAFSFTSEIAYWFKYDEMQAYNLSFLGDDDVWVFVNGKLVVELAGVHEPAEGSFSIPVGGTLSSESNGVDTTPSGLSLEHGKVYEVKVFQAERNPGASSFKLTLSGFDAGRSQCAAICGDGIIAGSEMCDDGENNSPEGETAHNRCAFDCTLGAYCGDGVKQAEEECDDNDPNDESGNECRGCQYIVIH